jgi:hypothetical protein
MHTPPLTWTIDANALSRAAASFSFEATGPELGHLAEYLEVARVMSFTAEVDVRPISAGKYSACGAFSASLIQTSVVNLEPVNSSVRESFAVEFWPAEAIPAREGDVDVTEEDLPETLENGRIPIGGLLCELLAVAIDPYPRNEGEVFEWEAEREDQAKPGPFAELIRLKPLTPDGG